MSSSEVEQTVTIGILKALKIEHKQVFDLTIHMSTAAMSIAEVKFYLFYKDIEKKPEIAGRVSRMLNIEVDYDRR